MSDFERLQVVPLRSPLPLEDGTKVQINLDIFIIIAKTLEIINMGAGIITPRHHQTEPYCHAFVLTSLEYNLLRLPDDMTGRHDRRSRTQQQRRSRYQRPAPQKDNY